jgi:hypothetical protein
LNEDGTPREPNTRELSSDSIYDEELIDPSLWKVYTLDDEIYEDYEILQKKNEMEVLAPRKKEPEHLSEIEQFVEWEKKRLAKRAPIVLTQLTDRSVPFGSEAKLTCSATGQECKIAWYKGEEQLDRSNNVQWLSTDGLHTLTLMNLTFKEQGVYTCEIKNRGGLVTTSARVHVYEDLDKSESPPTISLIRGE